MYLASKAMAMSKDITPLLFALAVVGCERDLDPNTPEGALKAFEENLTSKNIPALYQQLSSRTVEDLTKAQKLITSQGERIDKFYPKAQKADFEKLYPRAVRDATSPQALFTAFVEERLSKKRFLDGVVFGLEPYGKPAISEGTTRILTRAGENYTFVQEAGSWKVTLFEPSVHRNLERVLSNDARLKENLDRLVSASRKPSGPHLPQAAGPGAPADASGQTP